jgi:DNA-binding XRE family transcriptional regulator
MRDLRIMKCPECRQRRKKLIVKESHTWDIAPNGEPHKITLRNVLVFECPCGSITSCDATEDRFIAAYRQEANLLHPEDISTIRNLCRMDQETFAARIGVTAPHLDSLERGSYIQTREVDNAIRTFLP